MLVNINNADFKGEHKMELLRVFVGTNIHITTNGGTKFTGELKFVLPEENKIILQVDNTAQDFSIHAIAEFKFGGLK